MVLCSLAVKIRASSRLYKNLSLRAPDRLDTFHSSLSSRFPCRQSLAGLFDQRTETGTRQENSAEVCSPELHAYFLPFAAPLRQRVHSDAPCPCQASRHCHRCSHQHHGSCQIRPAAVHPAAPRRSTAYSCPSCQRCLLLNPSRRLLSQTAQPQQSTNPEQPLELEPLDASFVFPWV